MTVEPPDRIADMFVAITFDGTWPDAESAEIWEHFVVDGSSPEIPQPLEHDARPVAGSADRGS